MKPLFTIHEGEFLVGDYINRKLGRKFDVWVPSKDSGVDLLVTRKRHEGKPVRLQVKFSRSFDIREDFACCCNELVSLGTFEDPQESSRLVGFCDPYAQT
jgi:hypothetical protein